MTIPATETASPALASEPLPRLAVVVRRDANGPELKRAAVPAAHLQDILAEMWRDGCLRRHLPAVPFEAMVHQWEPSLPEGIVRGDACNGILFASTNPRGEVLRRRFTVEAFAAVASGIVGQLVAAQVLQLGDPYHYELVVDQPAPAVGMGDEPSFAVAAESTPLRCLPQPVRPLLARAETIGEVLAGAFPVFYTREALADAEQFARRGAAAQPPRETGCTLVGPLCTCPESGELFPVVTHVLEATDADEQQHSLAFSGKTWTRMQAVIRQLQAQEATKAHRILGQAHGHNFPPAGGAASCQLCPKVEVCGRTSVFVSVDDRLWSQAVFSRQPWAVCHIFGLNARSEPVHALFTQHHNQLVERGFFVLADFPADVQG